MDLTLQDLQGYVSKINSGVSFLNNYESLNGRKLLLYAQTKIVLKVDKKIYRIGAPQKIKQRILTQKWLSSLGFDIILPETLEDFSNTTLFVSSQREIQANPENQNQLFLDYFNKYPELLELFKNYNFIWFNGRNCGEEDGQIKILDWAADLSVSENKLIDYKGEVLYEYAFKY